MTGSEGTDVRVTVAVPSLNQGEFLESALSSIFADGVAVEAFVADAGSTDATQAVIDRWAGRLSGWRSQPDRGQAAAINECVARGTAPYVAWLNSDDGYLPGGLRTLCQAMDDHREWPAVYGRVWNVDTHSEQTSRVWVEPFSERRLATRCIIAQPGTLIRREAWDAVGGLDASLHLAMDYDLWWRLYAACGPLGYLPLDVAVNRIHNRTKTRTQRKRHYEEAIATVRKHHGRVPAKWWLYRVWAVWVRSWLASQRS